MFSSKKVGSPFLLLNNGTSSGWNPLNDVMEKSNIDLDNPEFQNVWNLICYTRQSVFLTGKAGTGKSTFLKYICENTSKNYVVLAPTGIAAVNVGGVTMHSFFKIPFKPLLPDDPEFDTAHLRSRMKYSREFCKLLKELDLVIIDEISMVRADIIDFIDKILRFYSYNRREPFGGKQMLFIGDIFQLEPVVTGDMRDVLCHYYPQPYFFNAKVFETTNIVSIELKKVYRQSDPQFISMLDRIRVGAPLKDDISLLNSKVNNDADGNDEMCITLATTRDKVDSINDFRLDELNSAPVTFVGEVKGDFPANNLPTSLELTLKVGAQVVFIKNDQDKRWVNGTLGKIYNIQDENIMVELDTGEKHVVEPVIWKNIKYEFDEEKHKVIEKELGSFQQLPVRLAWALTIHKSQGLTFNNVNIDMGHGAFSGGQAYVALSRCRSLEGMSMSSTINERDIFVNPSIVRFSRTFNDDGSINEAIESARADELYVKALDDFEHGRAGHAWMNLMSAMNIKPCDELMSRFIRRKLNGISHLHTEIKRLNDVISEDKKQFEKLAAEYVALGKSLQKEGMEPTPIIANFDKAISIDAGCVEAWVGKGKTYYDIGEMDEAAMCYRKAHEIDAEHLAPIFGLALLYIHQNEYVEAMNWLLKAEKLDDENPVVHDGMALVYGKIGDKESAAEHLAIAKKLRHRKSRK